MNNGGQRFRCVRCGCQRTEAEITLEKVGGFMEFVCRPNNPKRCENNTEHVIKQRKAAQLGRR